MQQGGSSVLVWLFREIRAPPLHELFYEQGFIEVLLDGVDAGAVALNDQVITVLKQ